MNDRLEGKVALVTGAGSGIGEAIASSLYRAGASVFAVDRDGEALESLPRGPRMQRLACDLLDKDSSDRAVEKCLEAFGELSILVNNVGRGSGTAAHLTSDEDLDTWLHFNLKITFQMSRAALPHLWRVAGNIVNIASTMGFMGIPGLAAYASAKGGVIGLTHQMAAEYGPKGVRVNAIAPGVIETAATADRLANNEYFRSVTVGATPLGRVGRPVDIANAAVFLASDEAAFVSGHVLVVDGGASTSFTR
jgi:NAD(P)-dependent dehydrogenase (short-subunit alcohol dehydrogenase family)